MLLAITVTVKAQKMNFDTYMLQSIEDIAFNPKISKVVDDFKTMGYEFEVEKEDFGDENTVTLYGNGISVFIWFDKKNKLTSVMRIISTAQLANCESELKAKKFVLMSSKKGIIVDSGKEYETNKWGKLGYPFRFITEKDGTIELVTDISDDY